MSLYFVWVFDFDWRKVNVILHLQLYESMALFLELVLFIVQELISRMFFIVIDIRWKICFTVTP